MDASEGDAGEGDSMYTYETDERETFDGELSGQGNPEELGDGDTSGADPGLGGIDDPVSVFPSHFSFFGSIVVDLGICVGRIDN